MTYLSVIVLAKSWPKFFGRQGFWIFQHNFVSISRYFGKSYLGGIIGWKMTVIGTGGNSKFEIVKVEQG